MRLPLRARRSPGDREVSIQALPTPSREPLCCASHVGAKLRYRMEVAPDLLPHDADEVALVFDLFMGTVRRRAEENAFALKCCDPIYLGM